MEEASQELPEVHYRHDVTPLVKLQARQLGVHDTLRDTAEQLHLSSRRSLSTCTPLTQRFFKGRQKCKTVSRRSLTPMERKLALVLLLCFAQVVVPLTLSSEESNLRRHQVEPHAQERAHSSGTSHLPTSEAVLSDSILKLPSQRTSEETKSALSSVLATPWQVNLLRLREHMEGSFPKQRQRTQWVFPDPDAKVSLPPRRLVGDGGVFLDLLVHHASAIYVEDLVSLSAWNCSRCTIPPVQNFNFTSLIIDEKELLQAYVGVHHDKQMIVVCFRGTHSTYLRNWIADLYAVPLDLNFPGVDHAYVHRGFYEAYHHSELKPRVTAEVLRLLEENPTYPVAITGHSLGGALASLCGLDLVVNIHIPKERVWVATFGSPRVGNPVFAEFFNTTLPFSVRVTHNRDVVVHLPPHTPAGLYSYHHVAQEIWYHKISIWKSEEIFQACDDSGEDLSCSRSISVTSLWDHLIYMGIPLC